jgi:hypothetical protein
MSKNLSLALTALILAFGALAPFMRPRDASAQVIIQGVTPGGGVNSVGVTTGTPGALLVQIGTGSVTGVTVVAPLPLPVVLSTLTVSVVTLSTSSTVKAVVSASTTTTVLYGQGSGSGYGAAFQVLAANPSAHQSTICNLCGMPTYSCGGNLFIGDVSVSTTTGFAIPPGCCYYPDNPASFQGALYGVSSGTTATVQWSWITH